jgi:oligopeptide/dipeptide ABC transporter ATP-binding protein
MENKEKVLQVKDLELWFVNEFGAKKILNGISFDIYKGETLGIVGESGCGKSVTSLSIMRLLNEPPATLRGEINFQGRNLLTLSEKQMQPIRGNRISMIFQEPMTSLNPVFTIGNQLTETFTMHQGLSKKEAKEKCIELLRMVRIPEPEQRFEEFPHQLSGGMRQRVMIAMALACQPELLIADEPTTALDVTIQAQVLELMKDLQKEMGTSIAFITHDLGVISEMCDRVVVLYCGEVVEEALVDDIFDAPKHPYTIGLLSTLPKIGSEERLAVIPGVVPPAGKFPTGCVFAPRCKYATEKCHACKPDLVEVGEGHRARCFRYAEGWEGE